MSYLASTLELDQSLIEVRHAATHAVLPPLSVLVEQMNRAMDWLCEHYWKPQADKHRNTMNKMRDALTEYRTAAIRLISQGKQEGLEEHEKIKELFSCCDVVNSIQDTLVPLLMEEGCLFPSHAVLQSSLLKNWLIEHFKSNEELSASSDGTTDRVPLQCVSHPPTPLLCIWRPVLSAFSETWPHFFSVLFQSMVNLLLQGEEQIGSTFGGRRIPSVILPLASGEVIVTGEEVQRLILCSWVNYLWDEYGSFDPVPTESLSEDYVLTRSHNMLQPDLQMLYRQSMMCHTKWARYLSALFRDRKHNSGTAKRKRNKKKHAAQAKIREKLTALEQVSLQMESLIRDHAQLQSGLLAETDKMEEETTNDMDDVTTSLEEFERILGLGIPNATGEEMANPWVRCSEWMTCPIGTMPSSSSTDLRLPTTLDAADKGMSFSFEYRVSK